LTQRLVSKTDGRWRCGMFSAVGWVAAFGNPTIHNNRLTTNSKTKKLALFSGI